MYQRIRELREDKGMTQTQMGETGIRFEPELLYQITYVAKKNKRSLNAQLEYLAQCCVEQFEAENGPIPMDEEKIYSK